ncbi:tryptophan synthase subunit alpha [Caminibacter mediatlanticus TB-2]|uniref:Tryptophan synthase alpha chain n=1 Tax=Caminibacter mediatlanticus TB-2 TaxID=391592 RepID=A0ABX5V8G2_9BACT|nr:tryptophan synthase subunit alpha [Caminibacter mediatlanticus]QCT94516.1 tryptophan synthase subunit alpha [Caminibacter mediatlanticus TB-2]
MKKLIAYITTAYPDKEFTIDLIHSLKENGVDGIELGIPFSDPVADGEIIQEVNKRALQNGYKINDTFYVSEKTGNIIDTYWMGYFNNFYHKGYDFMIEKAKEYNIKGFIIPDLPYEEAIEYENKFPLISFVAPTDSLDRIKTILQNPKEFIYLVAYAGITGSDKKEDLSNIIKYIKEIISTPLYIGFGVNENTAREKAKNVDGVIVGSTFVKVLLEDISNTEKIKKISQKAKIIKESIND